MFVSPGQEPLKMAEISRFLDGDSSSSPCTHPQMQGGVALTCDAPNEKAAVRLFFH